MEVLAKTKSQHGAKNAPTSFFFDIDIVSSCHHYMTNFKFITPGWDWAVLTHFDTHSGATA
jgi:hypothetical protein